MNESRGWEQIGPISGKWTPWSFAALAVESETYEGNNRIEERRLVRWHLIGSRFSGRWSHTQCSGTTTAELWERIGSGLQISQGLPIIAYKGSDTWPLIGGWNAIEQLKLTVTSCSLERRPFWIRTEQDTFPPINYVALENYLPDVEIEGLSVCDTAKRITALMCSFIDWWREHECGPWAWTTAGLAWNLWRKKCLSTTLVRPHDAAENLLARAAYYGPKCQPYFIGHVPTAVNIWDVTAQYPHICCVCPVPSKLADIATGELPKSKWDAASERRIAADCVVSTKRLTAPARRADGSIVYQSGTFRTQLAGPEFTHLWQVGCVVKVLGWAEYETACVLQQYQNWLWQWREKFSASYWTDGCDWIKLLMNSIVGKFGQRGPRWRRDTSIVPRQQWGEWIDTQANWGTLERSDKIPNTLMSRTAEPTIRRRRIRSLNGQCWVEDNSGDAPHSFPAVAAWIQSAARVYLELIRRELPAHWVLYSDTDSLHIPAQYDPRPYFDRIAPVAGMGSLRLEHSGDSADYYGWKHYRVGNKHVASGEPSSVIRREDGRLECWQPDPPFGTVAYRDKQTINYRLKVIDPNERDARGEIGDNRWVTPYVAKGDVDVESPLSDWLTSHSPPQ